MSPVMLIRAFFQLRGNPVNGSMTSQMPSLLFERFHLF